jgi:hypothetical protein
MGVLHDYFAATSDEHAALAGGLGPRAAGGFDCVEDTGIDPVVQLTKLAGLLTDRTYEEVKSDPRTGMSLGGEPGDMFGVLAVPDSVQAALVEADAERLRETVVPWSQTEEFWGPVDVEALHDVLTDLAGLARRADEGGQRLYCWWSL